MEQEAKKNWASRREILQTDQGPVLPERQGQIYEAIIVAKPLVCVSQAALWFFNVFGVSCVHIEIYVCIFRSVFV